MTSSKSMSSITIKRFSNNVGNHNNNNTRMTLAHLVNVKLAHLNDKWTSLLAYRSSSNNNNNQNTIDESHIVSSDGDGDGLKRCIDNNVNNHQRKRRLRRYRSTAGCSKERNGGGDGGDPKEFDMLVLRTVDWDDNVNNDSSY